MRRSLALLIVAVLLPACGTKGPLYLPEQKPAVAPANPPVPAPDTKADDGNKATAPAK